MMMENNTKNAHSCADCRHNPSFNCVKCYEYKHFEAKESENAKKGKKAS